MRVPACSAHGEFRTRQSPDFPSASKCPCVKQGPFLHLDEYTHDYPTDGPVELLEFFKKILVEVDNTIEAAEKIDQLHLICLALPLLGHFAMHYVDHAHSGNTPRGLARVLLHLRQEIVEQRNSNVVDKRQPRLEVSRRPNPLEKPTDYSDTPTFT